MSSPMLPASSLAQAAAMVASAPAIESIQMMHDEEVDGEEEDDEEEERQRGDIASHTRRGRARHTNPSRQKRLLDDEEDEQDDSGMNNGSFAAVPAVPAMSTMQLSGWLTLEQPKGTAKSKSKTGAMESKKRWCVLMRSFLFLAGRDKDLQHPKGAVDLKGCTISLARALVGDGPGSPPPHLPCAFVLQAPGVNRPPLTFTANNEEDRERWMRTLQTAIIATMAPPSALLSYKGRQIFDAEDAAAIAESRAAVKGFVSEQLQRAEGQRAEVTALVARKRADCKDFKAQKKLMAAQLIAATEQLASAQIESDALRAQLALAQQEGQCYDRSQHACFLNLLAVLNQMEECDPNRLTIGADVSPAIGRSTTFSGGSGSDRPRSGSSGSSSSSSAQHSLPIPPRKNGGGTSATNSGVAKSMQQLSTIDDESHGDSVWVPSSVQNPSALTAASSASKANMKHKKPSGSPPLQPYRSGGLGARSATSANFASSSLISDGEDDEDDENRIEQSNVQLQRVLEQIDSMPPPIAIASAISTFSSAAGVQLSSSASAAAPQPSIASTTSSAVDLLSRADSLELQEVQTVTLAMLRSNLKLRLEQNTLTKYIDAWMKRKHAIALLRME